MDALLSLLKPLDAPGSVQVLALCLAIALALRFIWPRRRIVAGAWLASVLALYLLLALPIVCHVIAATLPPVDAGATWRGGPLDTLIVLDGDNRRGRVATAKRVFDLAGPSRVWLLGNPWMWDALWREGVRYDSIRIDPNTPNTRAQVAWIKRFTTEHDGRLAIIASRLQMPRVEALLRAQGISAPLIAAPADDEPPTEGAWQFMPTYYALRISRDALYEHVALRYYRLKGWTK